MGQIEKRLFRTDQHLGKIPWVADIYAVRAQGRGVRKGRGETSRNTGNLVQQLAQVVRSQRLYLMADKKGL